MSLVRANVIALAALALFAVAGWGLWRGLGLQGHVGLTWSVALLLGVPTHEALHLVGFRLAGARWRDVGMGFYRRALTPYATCRVALPARRYAIAAALPGVALGLVPLLVGLATRSFSVSTWALVMTAAAAGDVLVIFLLRDVPVEALVLDHPSRAGCLVLVPAPVASPDEEARNAAPQNEGHTE